MNLDDFASFKSVDSHNVLAEIDGLPDQLVEAWALGQSLELPAWEDVRRVLIVGMGGSAVGADLLIGYITPSCQLPVKLVRNYDIPAWAAGPETLVICSSHSGSTVETHSAFQQALAKGCRVLVITTGGELAVSTLEAGACLWIFPHQGQPCTAVGYSFGLLLAAFDRLGLIPDPEDELVGAIAAMRVQQVKLYADVPVMENPAKRLAGQCFGRTLAIFGADFLVPVARRWKGQIGEFAKCWAQSEEIPEANHNFLAGVVNPGTALRQAFAIFLRGEGLHPHNLLRMNLTKEIFMLEGIGTDFFDASGKNRFEQMWTTLHFGDYLAYYLSMAYEADPGQVEAIVDLKTRLQTGK